MKHFDVIMKFYLCFMSFFFLSFILDFDKFLQIFMAVKSKNSSCNEHLQNDTNVKSQAHNNFFSSSFLFNSDSFYSVAEQSDFISELLFEVYFLRVRHLNQRRCNKNHLFYFSDMFYSQLSKILFSSSYGKATVLAITAYITTVQT